MSPQSQPYDAPTDLEGFCLQILMQGNLDAKLASPTTQDGEPLPDTPSGPIRHINRPARDPGIEMRSGGDALPAPGELRELKARQLCLSRFAHHELQAVEYFAWALLRWPEAPAELRRGLVAALVDEQRHCRLYLDRLAELGGRFDSNDHSDYFWRQAPAIGESDSGMRAFLSAMGLTLEQANLDFTLTYRDAFATVGDDQSAAICQRVHNDEIAHVALAARWLGRLSRDEATESKTEGPGTCSLENYLETVPFPLGPARAKGRRFEVTPRRRAGLPEDLIEHVRHARVQERITAPIELLPNLGAEEEDPGSLGRAYRDQAPVRTAAHLWSLLFPRHARLHPPASAKGEQIPPISQASLWPNDLGPPPSEPIFDFLGASDVAYAWLTSKAAVGQATEQFHRPLAGAPHELTLTLHDKAFAIESANLLGLQPRGLEDLLTVLGPEDFADEEALIAHLSERLSNWPAWTGQRFTLKPRQGSSGRGRVGGTGVEALDRVRGALDRLARRGGAVLEPWLDRRSDYSVSLFVPPTDESDEPIRILGSLESWCSASGVYRGHFGEIDSRGRVFSGDRDDEASRADAAGIATRARELGYTGPCGVDGFRYVQPMPDGDEVERSRSVVEFNARPTMGLVAIGLAKRALPRVRKRLAIQPGDRHGFALTYHAADDREWRRRIYHEVGNDAVIVDLARASAEGDPCASLVFARDPDSIRRARAAAFRC